VKNCTGTFNEDTQGFGRHNPWIIMPVDPDPYGMRQVGRWFCFYQYVVFNDLLFCSFQMGKCSKKI